MSHPSLIFVPRAKTAIIYRNDGTSHRGPRTDYNAFGDVPTYSSSNPIVYGNKAIEIDEVGVALSLMTSGRLRHAIWVFRQLVGSL